MHRESPYLFPEGRPQTLAKSEETEESTQFRAVRCVLLGSLLCSCASMQAGRSIVSKNIAIAIKYSQVQIE